MSALAWRLQRGGLLGWTVGFTLSAVALGSLTGSITDAIKGNPVVQAMFERLGGSQALLDSYLAGMLTFLGLTAALYTVQVVTRARAEEVASRADLVLATSVTRWRWLGAQVAGTLGGTAVLMLSGGLALGIAAAATADVSVAATLGGAVAQLPAVWLVAAVCLLLFAARPSATSLGWLVATGVFVLSMFGRLFNLPERIIEVSPFQHLPALPGTDLRMAPLLILLTATAAVTTLALVAFRGRDLAG